jgi:LysR family transcriptional regulator, glycine cleavage system transcriptional activator
MSYARRLRGALEPAAIDRWGRSSVAPGRQAGRTERAMETQLPPLTALRCFETAARRQSFTLAANELFLTPSAVSHQIKSLEAFLDTQLFLRAGRKMLLTDAGASYYEHIRSAFNEILAATRALAEPRTGATLKVNVAPHFASVWLMPRFADFVRTHHDLELQVFTHRHPVSFADSSIDCEIRYGHGKWLNLCSDLLLHDVLTPLCSPRLAASGGLAEPADITKHTLIYSNRRTSWSSWAAQCHVSGVERATKLHVDRSTLALDAAIAGIGIALESVLLADQAMAAGELVAPLKQHCISKEAYYLAYPKSHAKIERVSLFRSWLMNMLKEQKPELAAPSRVAAAGKAA